MHALCYDGTAPCCSKGKGGKGSKGGKGVKGKKGKYGNGKGKGKYHE